MLLLMFSIVVGVLVVGTAALAGHPFSMLAAGVLLAAAVLLLTRRRTRQPIHREK